MAAKRYEYAVLVTDLRHELVTIAQLYRDRADAENTFDELKNQWGWGGFTTQDLARCRLSALAVAPIYNWWSLFVRLGNPKARLEAITSRPFLLSAVTRQTTHSGRSASHHHLAARSGQQSAIDANDDSWPYQPIQSSCGAVENEIHLAVRLRVHSDHGGSVQALNSSHLSVSDSGSGDCQSLFLG